MSGTPPKATATSPFREAVEGFVHDLDAIWGSLPPLMVMSWAVRKSACEKWNKWLEENGKSRRMIEGKAAYKIEVSKIPKTDRLERKRRRAETAYELLPKSSLVSLVSAYDAFLGRLLRAAIESQPKVLNRSGKSMTFEELSGFPDMAAARSSVVSSVIESVMRESHIKQFDWMQDTFNVKLRVGLDCWPDFVEITQRRNLFVHCRGVVSSQYVKVCKENGASTSDIVVGDCLDASREYLDEAHACLYEIGVKLSQVLWRKLVPNETAKADSSLANITYELLVARRYGVVKRLLSFAVDVLPNVSSEDYERTFLLNLAQAHLFSGERDACRARVSSKDWSASGLSYKISVAVLLEDYENAAQLMAPAASAGEMPEENYYEWPLFRKYRKSGEFAAASKEVFGERAMSPQRIVATGGQQEAGQRTSAADTSFGEGIFED
ncbi:hypothetical protein [Alienimonas sp. DA493]|uniref:hypothetical protein n=1 Tax=Alienimonas sp. DA493 TaxID=3373605 RepID=UPI003754EE40